MTMARLVIFLLGSLVATSAFAQQEQSPSEFALQMSNMAAQIGLLASQQERQIKDLTKQNELLRNEIKELKEKKEPAK